MSLLDGILLLLKSKFQTSNPPTEALKKSVSTSELMADPASFPNPQHFLKKFMGFEGDIASIKKVKQNQTVVNLSRADPETTAFLDGIIEEKPPKK